MENEFKNFTNDELIKSYEEIVKFYETIVGDTYNDNSWLGNKLKGIKDSLDKITGGNAFGITSGVISGLIQAGFDVWMMSKGMKWIRSLVGIANPTGQGAVSGVMNTITNTAGNMANLAMNPANLKSLMNIWNNPVGVNPKMLMASRIASGVGTLYRGYTALNAFSNGEYLKGTGDSLKSALYLMGPVWGLLGEVADVTGGLIGRSDLIQNFISKKSDYKSVLSSNMKNTATNADLLRETGLTIEQLTNLKNQNKTVDEIREYAKRINARPEEIKQEPVKTTSSMIEQQQKQIEINEEKSVPLELGEKTISALSEAFSKAIKPVGNYLNDIGKDNKEIARYGRNSSVGFNGTKMNPTY